MKYLSLFSGIGGFDLAFQRAGMECVGVCEIDKNCQKILHRHFPDVPIYDDVRKVGRKTHARKTVDLVCGGFPCQDLSVAGRRKGLAGERSGLWFEFARVIDELEPQWVVIENVPGLLSSDEGRDFATILQWLVKRGYGVAWRVLDAQYFGVAQRRRRVFVVASFGSGSAAQVLFESESVPRDPAESRKTGKDVAYAVRADPSHSGDKGDGGVNTTLVFDEAQITSKLHKSRSSEISQPLNTLARMSIASILRSRQSREGVNPPGRGGEDDSNLVVARPIAHGKTNNHGDESQQTYIVEQNNIASTPDMISLRSDPAQPAILAGILAASGAGLDRPAGQGNELDFLIPDELQGTDGALQERDTKGIGTTIDDKMIPFTHSGYSNKPAWLTGDRTDAIPAGGQHPSSHQGIGVANTLMGVRRLTPTECERLQGFPDGWTSGQSDSVRYRQLGNAVAVPVVEWIGRRIVGIT